MSSAMGARKCQYKGSDSSVITALTLIFVRGVTEAMWLRRKNSKLFILQLISHITPSQNYG